MLNECCFDFKLPSLIVNNNLKKSIFKVKNMDFLIYSYIKGTVANQTFYCTFK